MPPLVRKAPAAAPLVNRWSGLYVGGNLGYGFARSNNSLINSSGLQRENFDLGVTGVVGGGQVGFNWHLSPNWVAGLEGDFQGSKQNASACTDICNSQFGLFAVREQKISWFDTVRARLGWTNGPSLFYVTGGLAYGQVRTWLNEKLDTAPFSNITFTHNKSGWTAGTGIETWLSDHWTAKAEYLYLYLGHTSDSFVYLNAPLVILTRDSRVQKSPRASWRELSPRRPRGSACARQHRARPRKLERVLCGRQYRLRCRAQPDHAHGQDPGWHGVRV